MGFNISDVRLVIIRYDTVYSYRVVKCSFIRMSAANCAFCAIFDNLTRQRSCYITRSLTHMGSTPLIHATQRHLPLTDSHDITPYSSIHFGIIRQCESAWVCVCVCV